MGEGEFTVQADCLTLGPVLLMVLKRKLLRLLAVRDFSGYRALLNQQTEMLKGLGCEPIQLLPDFDGFEQDLSDQWDSSRPSFLVMKFFHQNGFSRISESDSSGWLPIHYAALNGDPSLVRDLLELRADPKQCTRKAHADLGFEAGTPPVSIACLFKNNEVVRLLLQARASFFSDNPFHKPLNSALESSLAALWAPIPVCRTLYQ